jgi:cell division protein FtsB
MAKEQPISGMWTLAGIVGFLILVGVCIVMIYPTRKQYARQLEFHNQVQQEAERKRAIRDSLQREVAELERSPLAIEKVARKDFRFCREGEVVIYYEKAK